MSSRPIVTEGRCSGRAGGARRGRRHHCFVPIIDVTGSEPVEHRGYVPPRAIVVPGVRQREFPAGRCLPTPLIVGWRNESHDRLALNDALREHGATAGVR